MSKFKAVLGLLSVLAFICYTDAVAVMSVDLGSEYLKIAIVKPGVPMEIVLNKESSRKTRNVVAFRDGERHFSNQAYTTSVKFPRKAFSYILHVIGKKYDDPHVELFRKRFPYYNMIKDEDRGTVLFKLEDDIVYSPEELLAMILENAKENAEAFAEQPIKDAVITVPGYFHQAERKALLEAADMIGLNILQLMSDNAAVALNYGVFRRKNFNSTMQYYMFFDMGATSTVVTVVGYHVVKIKEGTRLETNPQVVIKGVGYDRNLGGLEITLRLREHLAKLFNDMKKTKTDVHTNERAMAKLLKEADRVKHVLSANVDHYAQVEGLLEEKDFKAKVTRIELEEMCEDLFARVKKPIEDALKISEITMSEINEVILMGAGTRMPRIKDILMEVVGRNELGKSINTDEAAALGAVYQAAYLGKGFKVKTFSVKEGNLYPIVVEFNKHTTSDDGSDSIRTVRRTLFGRMNPFPQKKVMTFNKHFEDFTFGVSYGDLDFLSEDEKKLFPSMVLANVTLEGIKDAQSKHGKKSESKGVKAHFRMDESGLLTLDRVESVFERSEADGNTTEESTWSKLGTAIGGLFGGKEDAGGSDKTTDTTDEKVGSEGQVTSEDEQKQESETAKEEVKKEESKEDKKEEKEDKKDKKENKKEEKEETDKKNTTQSKGKNDTKAEEAKKPKNVTIKEEIKSKTVSKDLPSISKDKMKESRERLRELKRKDQEKVELEKAKNNLESYIFDMQDKMSQDEYKSCATESEQENMNKLFTESSDWLYETSDDTKIDEYKEKLKALKTGMKDILHRVKEKNERPKALNALKSMINSSEFFLATLKNISNVEEPIFTEVEVTTLDKLINETKKWRDDHVKIQSELKDSENPKLLVETIAHKIQALDREVKYLVNKAKTFKPKSKPKVTIKNTNSTKKTDSNNTSTTSDDSTSTTTGDESTQVPPTQEEKPVNDEDKTDATDAQTDDGDVHTDDTPADDSDVPTDDTQTDDNDLDTSDSLKDEEPLELGDESQTKPLNDEL